MSLNTKTIAEVVELAKGKGATGQWLTTLETLANHYNRIPRGTMRQWFKAHHGEKVDTIQAQPHSLFVPAGRTIDAERRAGSVSLDGSMRDYAGCTVLHADDTTLLVTMDNGDSWAMYTLSV